MTVGCEKHIKPWTKGDWCPICLIEERDDLKAENERLRKKHDAMHSDLEIRIRQVFRLKKKVEMLKADLEKFAPPFVEFKRSPK